MSFLVADKWGQHLTKYRWLDNWADYQKRQQPGFPSCLFKSHRFLYFIVWSSHALLNSSDPRRFDIPRALQFQALANRWVHFPSPHRESPSTPKTPRFETSSVQQLYIMATKSLQFILHFNAVGKNDLKKLLFPKYSIASVIYCVFIIGICPGKKKSESSPPRTFRRFSMASSLGNVVGRTPKGHCRWVAGMGPQWSSTSHLLVVLLVIYHVRKVIFYRVKPANPWVLAVSRMISNHSIGCPYHQAVPNVSFFGQQAYHTLTIVWHVLCHLTLISSWKKSKIHKLFLCSYKELRMKYL